MSECTQRQRWRGIAGGGYPVVKAVVTNRKRDEGGERGCPGGIEMTSRREGDRRYSKRSSTAAGRAGQWPLYSFAN